MIAGALELEQRERVQAIAREWIGTPYHHRAALKGVGVDCARILIEVYADAGLIAPFDPGNYSRDWHLHRGEERYLEVLETYSGKPIKGPGTLRQWDEAGYKPLTGNILIWQVGRTYSHSAIITEWPAVVHASAPSAMVEEASVVNSPVYDRLVLLYSLWGV